MNVGLRPRLKARPSLYDLVQHRGIDHLSSNAGSSNESFAELPPLPTSPFPSTSLKSPTGTTPPLLTPEPTKSSPNMPPKKDVSKDEDGEEQYGMLPSSKPASSKLTITAQVPFTPSQGMLLSQIPLVSLY